MMGLMGWLVGGVLLALGLVALRQALRRRRFYAHPGNWRRRGPSHALLARLQTTPAQEQVLAEARTQLQAVRAELRAKLPLTREAAARSVEGEAFDEAGLRERFGRHAALLEELQRAALAALARAHGALEPQQRRELAAVLAGPCRPRLAR